MQQAGIMQNVFSINGGTALCVADMDNYWTYTPAHGAVVQFLRRSFDTLSGVCGFEGSRGVRSLATSGSLAPHPTPTLSTKKISPDFYVLHGPRWAAQGVRTPGPPGQLRRWTLCLSKTIKLIPTNAGLSAYCL